MKKILTILAILTVLLASEVFAANPGKEINNKCRANLKALNSATADFLKSNRADLPKWAPYKLVFSSLIEPTKYLDKKIESPTPDCQYFLVSIDNNDYQWYCEIHGVLEGERTLTFRYHEHELSGKTCSRYMINENYEKHAQNLLHWTEYTPTPLETFKYHYNTNPLTTTILSVLFVVVAVVTIKQFFRF